MNPELPPVLEPPSWHVRVGSRGIWRRRWWEWFVIGYAAMVAVGILITTVQDANDHRGPWVIVVLGVVAAAVVIPLGWLIQRRATVHVSWEGLDLDPWPLATWHWRNITWIRRMSETTVEVGYRLRVQILTFADAAATDGFMDEVGTHAPRLVPIEARAITP